MSITPLSLQDLAELLPRLQATVELLAGQQQRAATGNGRAKRAGGRARRVDGSAVRDRLLATLKGAKKGMSLGELTAKLKLSDSIVGYNLRQLRSQKKTRLVGSRRQARWFAQ